MLVINKNEKPVSFFHNEHFYFAEYNEFKRSLTEMASILKLDSFEAICEKFNLELWVVEYKLIKSNVYFELLDFGFDKKGEIVLFHNVLFLNMLTFIQKELSYSVYSEFKTNFQFNKFKVVEFVSQK